MFHYGSTNGHAAPAFASQENPTTNGNGNAAHSSSENSSDGGYAVAGPSTETNGYSQNQYTPTHNERIIDHLYHAGFQMGEYADTLLHAHQITYRLHAIILSRSPYLAHLMSTSPEPGGLRTVYVPMEQFPEISDQGFAVALGYLYSSVSANSLDSSNARAVLAAACLLGGMDDLCSYAYQACRDSISVETINEWIDFVDSLTPSDGTVTPSELTKPTIFGPYAAQLRTDVLHFLVVTLPSILEVQSPTSTGRETLLQVLARVPFDLFKYTVESPTFLIGSDQERFRFAKAAIELRKRTRRGAGEETVVLAFGGGHSNGSAVHVTRKTRKRALFKVEG